MPNVLSEQEDGTKVYGTVNSIIDITHSNKVNSIWKNAQIRN